MRTIALVVSVLAFAISIPAQITATVGPSPAPIGSPILIAVSNDTATTLTIGNGCPYTVLDANGAPIAQPVCSIFTPFVIPPGGTMEMIPWDQTSFAGTPVAPGNYTVRVDVGGISISQPLVIGGTNLGVGQIGTLRPGTSRNIVVSSPSEPSRLFFVGASISAFNGIPTCNGTFPLDNDALLTFATTPGNGVFHGLLGVLDGIGLSRFTRISLPNNPLLSGVSFMMAALTVIPGDPCPVQNISPAITVTIN